MSNLQARKDQAKADALDAAARLVQQRLTTQEAGANDRPVEADVVAFAEAFYGFLMGAGQVPNEFEPPVVYRDQDGTGEWRWHQKAGNGEVVADSGEGHPGSNGKAHCIEMARRVTGHTPRVEHDPITIDPDALASQAAPSTAQQIVDRLSGRGWSLSVLDPGDALVVEVGEQRYTMESIPLEVPSGALDFVTRAVAALIAQVNELLTEAGEGAQTVHVCVWSDTTADNPERPGEVRWAGLATPKG